MNTSSSQLDPKNGPVIVGIHGLLNKPDAGTLKEWWKQAIHEGLRRNANVLSVYLCMANYKL